MAAFLSVFLIGSGCAVPPDLDRSLDSIVKPHRFSILKWELSTLFDGHSYDQEEEGVSVVREYFALVEELRTLESKIEAVRAESEEGDLASLEAELLRLRQGKEAQASRVEAILTGQIKEILAKEGIYSPLYKYLGLKANLPPVSFRLEPPPNLLVISPLDRILSLREILLVPGLNIEEMEKIEAEADKLNVSSLVIELGGLAVTYPSFVAGETSLRHTIDTAIEEWLHQYLVLTPLGLLYLLDLSGLARNYEIATINETVASMVSREIGANLCEQYYPECADTDGGKKAESGFDFNREMREIRRAVDDYLARGEVSQAEQFMEEKRQYLAVNGYYIRKLNQAYFAFHGTYADRPTSVSPIGGELEELRDQSTSLRDFLDTASGLTSHGKLKEAIK